MGKLESLQTVTPLGLLPYHIHHIVRQLGTFGIISFGPDVARAAVGVHKRVGSKEVGVRAGSDEVEHAGFEVDLNRAGDIFRIGGFGKVDVHCWNQ